MLTHWARDAADGERFSIEHVVHKQTRATAELYGLLDRGALKPGLRADVNIIDFENLKVGMPKMVFDLPTGAQRIMQIPTGYVASLVAGVVGNAEARSREAFASPAGSAARDVKGGSQRACSPRPQAHHGGTLSRWVNAAACSTTASSSGAVSSDERPAASSSSRHARFFEQPPPGRRRSTTASAAANSAVR